MPGYMPTEEIDVFATGRGVGDEYLRRMQAASQNPATMQDYSEYHTRQEPELSLVDGNFYSFKSKVE